VRDLTNSSASRHVVEAVVNLATGFGLKTVGEGVEDQETLDLLRELGVDYAQGFHIGRPAPLHTTTQTHDTEGQRKWTTQTEPRGLESSTNSTKSRRSSI
jgi:EAL domain-containing protein (putative c-di-GMP-specific phosphodiesterase class I)